MSASVIMSPAVEGTSGDTPESHRYAKVPHLWALGVGAVIGGDFYGWQSTLIAGYLGLLVILAFVTVLYVLLSFSIAEMSSMMPTGGGPYVFSLHGIGPRAAFFAGLAETLKVVVTVATTFYTIFLYLDALFGLGSDYSPLWWVLFATVFVGLNVMGVEASFRVQVFATLLSVFMLVIFYVGAATKLDYNRWVVQQDWEFTNWSDAIKGVSFGLWFYFGIEELPLAAEETIEPEKNMPRGLVASILTLVVLSFCTATFSTFIDPGAVGMYQSTAPLVLGYQSVFGDTTTTSYFTWITVIGIISSTHSFVFCMGRLLFAIARDGFFPEFLTKVHPTRGSAYAALIAGGVVSQVIAIVLHFVIGDVRLGGVLINLALIGGLISYAFQLTSYILLRMREPERLRPYKSPFGVPGAVLCLALCVAALAAIVYSGASDRDFRASLAAAVILFALGTLYFLKSVQPRLQKQGRASPTRIKEMRETLISQRSSLV
ncbi:Amino acid/polyamine transporter, partial [Globisporangium splendens]